MDAAVMPVVRRQRRAPSASRASVQPWKFPTHAGDAGADQGMVADDAQGKPIKIGAKVVGHARYVALQMAEVAITRDLFADILRMIAQLRPPPAASTA
jgi:hypothetical protein